MKRFLVTAALLLLFTSVGARPLNVLLITADDLGLQLSCYGDPVVKTPNLDRLAEDSVRFKTAYVTQASCSPSRSSLFTGLYPHANGQYGLANARVGFQVHTELIDRLLPNRLKRAGYRTGIIGKLHVNQEKWFAFDTRKNEGFGSREIVKQVGFARDFLREDDDRPWFLMFNLFDPHVARKRLPDGSRGPSYLPDQVLGIPEDPIKAEKVPPWPWQMIDTPEQRKKIAGYYNCVQRVDAALGLLMRELADAGVVDETLVVFLGDHGPPFFRGKTTCYEAGLRTPLIARWPGVSQAHVSDRLVSTVDIYPTIMEAAGLTITEQRGHGRSLRPILVSDSDVEWRSTLVGEFHYHGAAPFFPRRAITDGRFKLIHNLRAGQLAALSGVDGDSALQQARRLPIDHLVRQVMERAYSPPEFELYDLLSDPVEFRNRAGESALAEVETRLKRELAVWQRETKDSFVDPEFRNEVERKYQRDLANQPD